MELIYSNEKAAQILISLLKQHNIKKIVASPGTTNITFVASAMHDPWFEIYSSVDERSAAYIACGLSEESQEPVVITCTGATASRNYMPGLTEAYYRKLPILAVTASQDYDKIGHLSPQLLDRRNVPNDVARKSFTVKAVKSADDEWADEIAINNAILELKRHGGGPVHLNFQTTYSRDYSATDIKPARKIDRIIPTNSKWPEISNRSIGIFIASHRPFSKEETEAIDKFCGQYNAVVFTDHTSAYKGIYKVEMSLPYMQRQNTHTSTHVDLLIHMGGISGDPASPVLQPKEVWRVDEDGEIRDSFRKLTNVFEMDCMSFFSHYGDKGGREKSYLDECKKEYNEVFNKIPELPFSNVWIAQHTAHKIPNGSVIHLGILNTLRSWNYFHLPESVRSNSNVGGFGIDGILSTLIGASLVHKDKLYFAILGDLAFFYDMNAIGNRHVGNNVRILLINNGRGTEFRNYDHPGAMFGEESDKYIAAAGHFGNKSKTLVKHYAEDLGFEYHSASNKSEYLKKIDRFLTEEITEKPILFEVFTDSKDESDALNTIQHLVIDSTVTAKDVARNILGEKGIKLVKSIIGK